MKSFPGYLSTGISKDKLKSLAKSWFSFENLFITPPLQRGVSLSA
jgi:hypothetical protein